MTLTYFELSRPWPVADHFIFAANLVQHLDLPSALTSGTSAVEILCIVGTPSEAVWTRHPGNWTILQSGNARLDCPGVSTYYADQMHLVKWGWHAGVSRITIILQVVTPH